jgi:hypothetical protein
VVSESGSVDQERSTMAKKKKKKKKKKKREMLKKKNMVSLDIYFKENKVLRVFSEFILVYEFFCVVRRIKKK